MKLRNLIITFALLLASAPAFAEASPEAAEWLDRVHQLVEGKAFRLDYTFSLNGNIEGQAISADAQGNFLQGGPRLSVNELELEAAAGPGSAEKMSIHSRQVADGKVLWAETNMVSMGMTQVGKVDLEVLEEIAAARSGLQLGQSMMFMDPVSQMESLITAFDVVAADGEAGTVNLILTPTAETLAQLGSEVQEPGEMHGVLVLKEEGAVPVSLDVTLGSQLEIRMKFSNFEVLDPADLPEGTFSYTPAEGQNVMDMAPMLKAGM